MRRDGKNRLSVLRDHTRLYSVTLDREGRVEGVVIVDRAVVVSGRGHPVGMFHSQLGPITCEGRGRELHCRPTAPENVALTDVFSLDTDEHDGQQLTAPSAIMNALHERTVSRAIWRPEAPRSLSSNDAD